MGAMTYPSARVAEALELAHGHLSASEISRRTGIPRSTVRDWLGGRTPRAGRPPRAGRADGCPTCRGDRHDLLSLSQYSYLLGLYLGDGCISSHPRAVYKLRVYLDAKYPGIVAECVAAIHSVLPEIKVCQRRRDGHHRPGAGGDIEVYAYSKAWPCLFPQHGRGKKHLRSIELMAWQERIIENAPGSLLRGLIHSDGCRSMNVGRGGWRCPRYSFSNYSRDIQAIFCAACDRLGLRWTTAPNIVYVSRKADVARMDEFVGPKR